MPLVTENTLPSADELIQAVFSYLDLFSKDSQRTRKRPETPAPQWTPEQRAADEQARQDYLAFRNSLSPEALQRLLEDPTEKPISPWRRENPFTNAMNFNEERYGPKGPTGLQEGDLDPSDVLNWAGAAAKGIARLGKYTLPALAAPLFDNPRITQLLTRSVERLAGQKAAARYAQALEDVPGKYANSPALGMLGEYYDALGIKARPQDQSRFGVEIETGMRLPEAEAGKYIPLSTKQRSLLDRILARTPFAREEYEPGKFQWTQDPSVGSSIDYPYPAELKYPPIHGLAGAEEFADAAKGLQAPVHGGLPLARSGPEFKAGAHTSVSWPNMAPEEVRQFVATFMRDWEPTLYPGTKATMASRDPAYFAAPLARYFKHVSEPAYQEAFVNPSASLTTIGAQGEKPLSLAFHHLASSPKTQRLELRLFNGTADPNEWIKQMLLAENMTQEAKAASGQGSWFEPTLTEFQQKLARYYQTNKPWIQAGRPTEAQGAHTSRDPWLNGMMEPDYFTSKNALDVENWPPLAHVEFTPPSDIDIGRMLSVLAPE